MKSNPSSKHSEAAFNLTELCVVLAFVLKIPVRQGFNRIPALGKAIDNAVTKLSVAKK
jgi:hypothetical protein